MELDELKSIIESEISGGTGYIHGNKVVEERKDALERYLGRPYGNEIEGRSQVLDTTTADTIDSMMPGLLRPFIAGDKVVVFEPMNDRDKKTCEQMTDGVNYVITKKNNFLKILHTLVKDGLIQKNGYIKAFWDKREETTEESYKHISPSELMLLEQDENIEVLGKRPYMMINGVVSEQEPQPDPNDPLGLLSNGIVWDVDIRRKKDVSKVVIQNLAPEHVGMARGTVDLADSRCVWHRELKTISELREMGFEQALLDGIFSEAPTGNNAEEIVRRTDEDFGYTQMDGDPADPSMRKVWVFDICMRVDFDGDGIAELRHIVKAGDVILENEPMDEVNIIEFTPDPLPHQHFGRSWADKTKQSQLIRTTLKRQMLDNTYLANFPPLLTTRGGGVDLDALINRVPGAVVLTDKIDAVRELMPQTLPRQTFELYEMEAAENEQRTGVTRYNQGMDANSLNKTARGIELIQGASSQRQELVARFLADTVVRLFMLVAKLMKKYQDKEFYVRLRDKFVPIDPRTWVTDMDCDVNVGLGYANKENMANFWGQYLTIQRDMLLPMGLATDQEVYNTVAQLISSYGVKSPDPYAIDPNSQKAMQMKQAKQQQPQQENPEIVKAKIQAGTEIQKAQIQAQASAQTEAMKAQEQGKVKAYEAELKHSSTVKTAEMNSKPAAQINFNADQMLAGASNALQQAADLIAQIAVQNAQGIAQNNESTQAAIAVMTQALTVMAAPKKGTLPSGKTVMIEPVIN